VQINSVVGEAAGIPLFISLDPYGQNFPYTTLASILRDRSVPASGPPPRCCWTSAPRD